MSLEPDAIVDRRRLRRSVSFWRILAVLALIVAVGSLAVWWTAGDVGFTRQLPHIARIPIEGTITNDRKLIERIGKVRDNGSVRGVIVAINSPGGTTVGGETLYHALRELAEKKPTVAQIGTVGTSAGYMVALAADHIVAHHSSITGSIGVLVQYPEISRLLRDVGIDFNKVASGSLKAEPNPFDPTSPAAQEMLQEIVNDSFVWFKQLVDERRALDTPTMREISSGRVFTGQQALALNLVDTLGGEEAAIAWLETERGIAKDLPVRDWQAEGDGPLSFMSILADRIAVRLVESLGLPDTGLGRTPPVLLDGLVSLWHVPPPHTNSRLETGKE